MFFRYFDTLRSPNSHAAVNRDQEKMKKRLSPSNG